jgi:uncharacterized protein (TIGR03086 family)
MTVNTTNATHGTSIDSLHREALASTRRYVAGVEPDQWTHPTPCADWNVRALVNHVVVGNLWAAELARGHTIDDVGTRLDGDQLGPDPLHAYDHSAQAAAVAFEQPGALEAPCAVSYGPIPGSVYAGHRFIDVLVHGYDIAVATGQNPRLGPHLAEACWGIVEPQLASFRASGMFGPDPDGPVPTDPQRRLIAALGRLDHA